MPISFVWSPSKSPTVQGRIQDLAQGGADFQKISRAARQILEVFFTREARKFFEGPPPPDQVPPPPGT